MQALPGSETKGRTAAFRTAQAVLAVVVLGFIGWKIAQQWQEFRGHPLEASPRIAYVFASGFVVLAAYAVLIQTWRAILGTWDASLPFGVAARIWFVSNLGRYVPGKVWQILAMAHMAQGARVSPVAATGSAILSTIVNIACGIAVAMAAGWSHLDVLAGGRAAVAFVVLGATALTLLLLPPILPPLVAWLERRLGRSLGVGRLPVRAVAYAVVGNVAAWVLYGAAFHLLVIGVIGDAPGTTLAYIAVYAASYVIGYVFLFLPGGLGPRDASIAAGLPALALATPQQAAVIAVASRLWLTVLEVGPGLILWAAKRSDGIQPKSQP